MSHVPNERVWCQNCEARRLPDIHGRCENCGSGQVVSEHAQHMGRERAGVEELERVIFGRKP